MTGIVLRKTKLGESDLIITLLADDGSLKKGVAKGARKPTSIFAARLELYNKVDLLCAQGKSLDIIKEARLVFGGKSLHADIDKSMAAACVAELASKFMQPSLENPRLFEMTEKILRTLDESDAEHVLALVAAYYLKCFSICGIRPSFDVCVSCGSQLSAHADGMERFSYEDGGYVCEECASVFETIRVPAAVLAWSNVLLYATFEAVRGTDVPSNVAFEILQMCQQWCYTHVGSQVKSLKMFMSLFAAL